jgi:predicted nucleic acid-binding protein
VSEFLSLPNEARVTVDTAPIIYLLEDNAQFLPTYLPLFERIEAGEVCGVISVVTLSEVLAGPLSHGNEVLADRYFRALAGGGHWKLVEMDAQLAFMAARIRSRYRLKLPDAIQVATAIQSESIALVTHDRDFSAVKDVRVPAYTAG